MLTDAGINVVFSAGNTGPGAHTLNPYAAAPWVVSVGATDTQGRLASFSSRGDFANPLFHPTLVAPGVDVVSLRGSGVANVTGAEGLAGADIKRLSATELPYLHHRKRHELFSAAGCRRHRVDAGSQPESDSGPGEGHSATHRDASAALLRL